MMDPGQVHPGRAVRLRRLVLHKALLRHPPVVLDVDVLEVEGELHVLLTRPSRELEP